ncbi:MAG: hypothetical protein OSB09_08350, partial [Planctomycetota bacterium]|nr:hypothetical protein [Planctomycetota bacterium]
MFDGSVEKLQDLRLRISRFLHHQGLTLSSSKRRVPSPRKDVLFQNAALVSVTIHLIALLVLPSPGVSGESTVPDRVILRTRMVDPPPPSREAAPSEPRIPEPEISEPQISEPQIPEP